MALIKNMKLSNLKEIYAKYYPLSNYALFFLFIMPLYPIIRQSLLSTDSIIISTYARFLFQLSYNIYYLFSNNSYIFFLAFAKGLKIDTTLMALWPTFIVAIGSMFLHKPLWKRVLFFCSFYLIIIIFNIIRIIFLSFCYSQVWQISPNMLNGSLVLLIHFGLLWFALYWFRQNISFKRLLLKRFDVTKENLKKIVRNFSIAVTIIIVVIFFTYTQIIPFISYISKGVLHFSQLFLHGLGYNTYIWGRFIYTSEATIFFSDTCAGIELMLIYLSFILIFNGRKKLLFILSGLVIIFIMNILRISIIMAYLIHHKGIYSLPINIHDLYTYPVYLVTFLLWVIWINKFGNSKAIEPSC